MKIEFTQENLKRNQKLDNQLSKILSSKTLYLDIGANCGDFIYFIKSIASQSSFYAIEPDSIKFKILHQNCLEWEQGTTSKIYALNIAIGDRDGQADFYQTILSDGKSFFKPVSQLPEQSQETQTWEKVTVDIYKLDTLFKSMKPDLIKINVPGSELPILQGSKEILKLGKAKFLMTLNSQAFGEVEKLMNSFGYRGTIFDEIILFKNSEKDNQAQIVREMLKDIWSQTIPAPWRYTIKKFLKK